MMILTSLSLILCIILIVLNFLVSKKSTMDREKISPFECGFDNKMTARIPFSLRFYLIAVIFLIFDVEIALILPMPIFLSMNSLKEMFLISSFFIIILILGLVHEWNQGAINWD